MLGRIVSHKTFGRGTISSIKGDKITILFNEGPKVFVYPDAFNNFLTSSDQELMHKVNADLSAARAEFEKKLLPSSQILPTHSASKARERKKHKLVEHSSIAFKCNFCDGGKSPNCIGFNGVCSDALIKYNICKENHVWCSSEDSPCRLYLEGEISRKELDAMMNGGDGLYSVCYESQMLRDWRASAGVVQTGEDKGRPMRLLQVQRNSLAVLTSRDPYSRDDTRFIFAVFLVDDNYEGDHREAGYVSTTSDWKIALSPQEAHKVLFWNYYFCPNAPKKMVFGSGLHRYLTDIQAAQILRDIAEIRTDPRDQAFAKDFFEHFCKVNRIDRDNVPPPNGGLVRSCYPVG